MSEAHKISLNSLHYHILHTITMIDVFCKWLGLSPEPSNILIFHLTHSSPRWKKEMSTSYFERFWSEAKGHRGNGPWVGCGWKKWKDPWTLAALFCLAFFFFCCQIEKCKRYRTSVVLSAIRRIIYNYILCSWHFSGDWWQKHSEENNSNHLHKKDETNDVFRFCPIKTFYILGSH